MLAIGFTGHRDLIDEAKCHGLISSVLAEKKRTFSGILCGVCSIAAGGDILFAEACFELDIPVRALLPVQEELFRADFDPATWARAESVLRKAISVEVTGDCASTEQRYYECGIATVHDSQILVALWNGQPARGMGGTQEIVSFAKHMKKGVVWIHSETGQIQTLNENAFYEASFDSELTFLNSLSDAGVSLTSNSPTDLATAWLRKLDSNATRLSPQVRRMAAVPIVCTAVAAVISGAASRAHGSSIWLLLGIGLGVIASVLPFALGIAKKQLLWVRTRTAAEVCRSVLALWDTPHISQFLGQELMPELAGMLRSLAALKSLDVSRKAITVETFKEYYLKDRVSGQINYFAKHAAQSAREVRRFHWATWTSTGLAILLTTWMFLDEEFFQPSVGAITRNRLALIASALFQVATIAGALLIVNDCERRQRRYQQMHSSLLEWEREVKALLTWRLVFLVATRIENALLAELLEWRSLVRHRKMPRN